MSADLPDAPLPPESDTPKPIEAGQSTPPESPPATASDESSSSPAEEKPRIKIGTQRPGVNVPRVEPRAKVAFHTQPGAAAHEGKPQSEPPAKEESQEPARPPIKFKGKPRKPRFDVPIQPAGKVEKPNLRAPLPEELEIELQHAL